MEIRGLAPNEEKMGQFLEALILESIPLLCTYQLYAEAIY